MYRTMYRIREDFIRAKYLTEQKIMLQRSRITGLSRMEIRLINVFWCCSVGSQIIKIVCLYTLAKATFASSSALVVKRL